MKLEYDLNRTILVFLFGIGVFVTFLVLGLVFYDGLQSIHKEIFWRLFILVTPTTIIAAMISGIRISKQQNMQSNKPNPTRVD